MKLIRLCYRKIIDQNATKPWDQLVSEDSFREYCMQSQLYNQEKKHRLFSQLLAHVPASEKLHFLVSSAVIGYLQQLNGTIPDLQNALGKIFLPFSNYRFEIIQSDAADKTKHVVAVSFYSEPMLWHDMVHNQLLLSVPGNDEQGETLTDLFTLPPFVSIYSIKPVA